MSFTETETETVEAPAVEQVTETASEVTEPEPQAPILDLDEYGDHMVPLKVDGEVMQVPLREATEHAMRQQDYTRKTQELAAQREAQAEAIAIAEALRANPVETIKVLQEWYAEGDSPTDTIEDESLDPLERQVKELDEWRQAQENERAEQALRSELDRMADTYGVDQEALLRFAVENQIPNLEWAYAVMSQGRSEAEREVESERQAGEQSRLEAKHNAAVVDGGTNRSSGASTVPMGTPETVRTAEDAFKLAKAQMGWG